MGDKRRYIFYYDEALSAWYPYHKDLVDIESDRYGDGEEFTVRFKIFELTEQEYDNLPED